MADDRSQLDEVEKDEDVEMETEDIKVNKIKDDVYLPGKSMEDDEELVHDPSAYTIYHRAQTGAPCLSFDIIPDKLGDKREEFPLTCYLAGGTQAQKGHPNFLLVMKMHNLTKTVEEEKPEDGSDSDDDEEDEGESEDLPELDTIPIQHTGCVNRIRVSAVNNIVLAATWSENGTVYVYDLTTQLIAVDIPEAAANHDPKSKNIVQSFSQHPTEGFALDWSSTVKGRLATGDCDRFIHVWEPKNAAWDTTRPAYIGHTGSVEDIQWSPNEENVFASCSVDRTIRIWDVRATPLKACMLTVSEAHQRDINVIHWNHNEPFIASGGDDGIIKIWDLRLLKTNKPVASFKHHSQPVTSIEWHPDDSSVFAASGEDDQISIWDLAVEPEENNEEKLDVPPQLLFIHQGQHDIKEIHWHPQLTGVIISTAHSDFNIFRCISV